MSALDLPIPAELAIDDEPIKQHELLMYLDAVHDAAGEASVDLHVAAQWLADDENAMTVPARVARWRCESDDAAEWAMRKLALAEAELSRLREQANEWAERIELWFRNAAREHERTADFMAERLRDYGLRRREAGGGATLELPSGVIKTTLSKPAVTVEDDAALYAAIAALDGDALVEWSKAMQNAEVEQHELTKIEHKVYVQPLRKLVKIVEKPDGNVLRIEFGQCDHVVTYDFLADGDDVPAEGELLVCPDCPADPVDGEQRRPVRSAELVVQTKRVVVGPDGGELPGVVVTSESIDCTVKAR